MASDTGTTGTAPPHDPWTAFKNILNNINKARNFFSDSLYYAPNIALLAKFKQEIQDATSAYFINMPTTNKYLLVSADEYVN